MLELETPLTMIYRRDLAVAAADITGSSGALDDNGLSLSLDTQQVNIAEGQWVTLDADGNATLVTTATRLAFCVYAAGERLDVNGLGQVTGLYGKYIATTDQFDVSTGTTYAAGDELTVANGVLTPAAGADPVIAVVEEFIAATTAYPNGRVKFNIV
jgi:hypothetical protein